MTTETSQRPYFAEGTPAMVDLEEHVDQVGLANVLYALAHICRAKAEHVQGVWQDSNLARNWNADARSLDRWATKTRSNYW